MEEAEWREDEGNKADCVRVVIVRGGYGLAGWVRGRGGGHGAQREHVAMGESLEPLGVNGGDHCALAAELRTHVHDVALEELLEVRPHLSLAKSSCVRWERVRLHSGLGTRGPAIRTSSDDERDLA